MPSEVREIPQFPGYSATSDGEIIGARSGKPLKPTLGTNGYLQLVIRGKCKSVNRLVCEAFHGLPPTPKHHAAHWDGDKFNNRPENLRWATPQENIHDKFRHQTMPLGEDNWRAKLTEEQVLDIRRRYVRGVNQYQTGNTAALAEEFGVTMNAITVIIRREAWAHI